MKTYHVFIASSLRLQSERDLIKKVYEERNNVELNIIVHRFELNGDHDLSKGDTQKVIDDTIAMCDVVIFFAGNWIRSKTIHEFEEAIKSAANKHIFFYQNPHLDFVGDIMPDNILSWEEFYNRYMVNVLNDDTIIERYESLCQTPEQLRDALVRDRENWLNVPFSAIPCDKLDYNKIIPNNQNNRRRNERTYYIRRPDVDNKLEEYFNEKYRMIIVSGQSTSGKTLAVSRMIHSLSNYSVVLLNADTTSAELNRLSASQFQVGKKILLIDDIHLLFWKEENEKVLPIDRELIRKLTDIINLENPDLKIIATTTYAIKEIISLLTFNEITPQNVKGVEIAPLSMKRLNEYARELRTHGYLKFRPEAGMTIGSLFFDIDKIKTKYNELLSGNSQDESQILMMRQLCHAIKCLWMWKRRSRNQLELLLNFLQFTYPDNYVKHTNETMQALFDKLKNKDLVYPDYGRSTFEVEDIIVMQVFPYYAPTLGESETDEENKEKMELAKEKIALANIFHYIYKKDHLNFFRNVTKLLHRIRISPHAATLQQFVMNTIVEKMYPKEILYTHYEPGLTPEGIEADWVDVYLGTITNYVPTTAEAIEVWKDAQKHKRGEVNILKWLLPRLDTNEDKQLIRNDLIDKDGKIDPKYRDNTYVEFQAELIRFISLPEAKELYLNTSFLRNHTKTVTSPDKGEDTDDFFMSLTGQTNAKNQEHDKFLAKLKELRIRNYAQNIFKKIVSLKELEEIKKFLQINNKGVVPQDDSYFYFDFVAIYTWRYIVNALVAPNELKTLFTLLLKQQVERDDTHIQMNKVEILNSILELLQDTDAYTAWNMMGDHCDGYTLTCMLQKVGNFEQAQGIFNTFMEQRNKGEKMKINDIYLNALLDTTSTFSDIKECEKMFHKYRLLKDDKSLLDYPSQYTQGILYQRMDEEAIKRHMKRFLPHENEPPREIKTIAIIIKKMKFYATAHAALFGKCPDYITPEEQELLNHSPYIVSEMFRKVSDEEEGSIARAFFENEMDKTLLSHPNVNVLNIIINNKFIYPYYEQKVEMINRLSSQYQVEQNAYTQKHLLYHLINSLQHPIPTEEVEQHINNEIIKKCDASKLTLQLMLEQRFFIDSREYNVLQPFPVYTTDGWEIQKITPLEYVHFMIDNGYCKGQIIHSIMVTMLNRNDKENFDILLKKAKEKKVLIDYGAYCDLLGKGAIIPEPYYFVENYPVTKDICYRMRNYGVTFEQAEAYIREIESKTHMSVARTQVYWNNVISQKSNKGRNSVVALSEVKNFIAEHEIFTSSEVYYSMLHLIRSVENYLEVKAMYNGKITIDHIYILLKKTIEMTKYKVPEWTFVNHLRQEFAQWYQVLKEWHGYKNREQIIALADRYKNQRAITDKGYLNQTFLFWWTICYMAQTDPKMREREMDNLISMIPKQILPKYPDMIGKFFEQYPQEIQKRIQNEIERKISLPSYEKQNNIIKK